MDIDKRIAELTRALKLTRPERCKGCKFIREDRSGGAKDPYINQYCELIEDSLDSCINFELENDIINVSCPLLDPDDSEDQEVIKSLTSELEVLVELKEARIRLNRIETLAREAFADPETLDINLYRAQKLAEIYQIFEYNGSTIPREEG